MQIHNIYDHISEVQVRYKNRVPKEERQKITGQNDAVKWFSAAIGNNMEYKEEFWAMYLNRANEILTMACHGFGDVSGTVVDVQEVVLMGAKLRASACIVAHNHPSGQLSASHSDEVLSQKLKDALKLIDVNLLDSLIITEGQRHTSVDL